MDGHLRFLVDIKNYWFQKMFHMAVFMIIPFYQMIILVMFWFSGYKNISPLNPIISVVVAISDFQSTHKHNTVYMYL